MASTEERDNFIYTAKLAEQAERYDGFIFSLFFLFNQSLLFGYIQIYLLLHYN